MDLIRFGSREENLLEFTPSGFRLPSTGDLYERTVFGYKKISPQQLSISNSGGVIPTTPSPGVVPNYFPQGYQAVEIPGYGPQMVVNGRVKVDTGLGIIDAPEDRQLAYQKLIGATTAVTASGDVMDEVKNFLEKKISQGFAVNPNIQITPERVAEFMAQAQSEISPFYSTQLKLARESLLRDLGYNEDEVLRQEQVAQRNYGQRVRELAGTEAERGFALSGERQQAERQLAQATQEDIESSRRQLSFQAGTAARQFAGKYGGQELAIPTIPEAPRVIPGEQGFQTSGRQLPLYELSPDVYQGLVGQEEFQRRGAVRQRASELESAFRTQQATPRQLVL